jgi:hypothetical protein
MALALTVVTVGAAGGLAAAFAPGAPAARAAGARGASARSGHRRRGQAQRAPGHARTLAAGGPPLRVVSVSAGRGAAVNGADPVSVEFSAALAADSRLPTFRPSVRGTWAKDGATLLFTPSAPFQPARAYQLDIPGGQSGVRAAGGDVLARRVDLRFRTQGWSTLRVEQLLAQLHYLPLIWSQQTIPLAAPTIRLQPAGSAGLGSGRAAQLAAAYDPPPGTFRWRPGYPSTLTSLWRPGKPNLVLTGAVMAFESQHGLPLNRTAGPRVWSALLRAVARKQRNTKGYTYALARKGSPETLTVWHNGSVLMKTLTNTGIPASPTVDGTFPVYLRFQFTIMSGFNPDGSHYSDPVWWVSYFNGGDAVHYFPRASYGFPQSLGCCELQWGPAKKIWPYMNYGTLVSVVN